MKNRFYFLLLLLGMLMCSCENAIEENNGLNVVSTGVLITKTNPIDEVTVDVVKKVAGMYGNAQGAQTRGGEEKIIEEVVPVKNEKGDVLMYVVNYAGNAGYVILSGTNEYQPILAYSETGKFDVDKNDGTQLWLKEQMEQIELVNLLPDAMKRTNQKSWNRFFEKEVAMQMSAKAQTRVGDLQLEKEVADYVAESVNRWRMEGYKVYAYGEFSNLFSDDELWLIESIVNDNANDNFCGGINWTVFLRTKTVTRKREIRPLLQSRWNQIDGYQVNGYPAGCIAVAMGQIMRYHEYPVLYNWQAMSYNSPTTMTVNLLAEIGKKVGMRYDKEESDATLSAACSAFKQYGYSQSKIVGHSDAKVISNLLDNRPVMMGGTDTGGRGGHAWVCDGFKETDSYEIGELMVLDRFSCERIPEYNMVYDGKLNSTIILDRYYHMNWGWGGSQDGYFYENAVNPLSYNFSTNRKDIVDIYPAK